MTRRARRLARSPGQALVLVAILLALVLVPLGLAVLAINQLRADHATLTALVRTAALDGAGVLADATLGTQAPMLSGSSASCAGAVDSRTAAGRACRTLRDGLIAQFGRDHPHVRAADALDHTLVTVLDGTPAAPVQDPTTGAVYHYPTVCVSSTIRIGVWEYDGLGITAHFHACAQTAFR